MVLYDPIGCDMGSQNLQYPVGSYIGSYRILQDLTQDPIGSFIGSFRILGQDPVGYCKDPIRIL